MSEEEKKAIENLKEVVDLYNDECLITTDYDFKSIEILLNLIEKQQKEIEDLKKPKYIINFETNEITKLTNEFISKDKIKAKIEECREILYSFEKELELKANKNKFIHKESMNCLLGQISILQSLLEEE